MEVQRPRDFLSFLCISTVAHIQKDLGHCFSEVVTGSLGEGKELALET